LGFRLPRQLSPPPLLVCYGGFSGAAAHARSSLTSLATGLRLLGCGVAAAVAAARALAGSSVAAVSACVLWRASGAAAHARPSLTFAAAGSRRLGCCVAAAVSTTRALTGSSVAAASARLLWQASGAAAHARSSLTSLATGWRLRGCRVAAAVPAARALAGSSVAAAFAHLFWRVSGAAAHARSSLTSLATGWRLRGCRMATAVSAACALTGSPVAAAFAHLFWRASGAAAHARSSLTFAAAGSRRLGCCVAAAVSTTRALTGSSVAAVSARLLWQASGAAAHGLVSHVARLVPHVARHRLATARLSRGHSSRCRSCPHRLASRRRLRASTLADLRCGSTCSLISHLARLVSHVARRRLATARLSCDRSSSCRSRPHGLVSRRSLRSSALAGLWRGGAGSLVSHVARHRLATARLSRGRSSSCRSRPRGLVSHRRLRSSALAGLWRGGACSLVSHVARHRLATARLSHGHSSFCRLRPHGLASHRSLRSSALAGLWRGRACSLVPHVGGRPLATARLSYDRRGTHSRGWVGGDCLRSLGLAGLSGMYLLVSRVARRWLAPFGYRVAAAVGRLSSRPHELVYSLPRQVSGATVCARSYPRSLAAGLRRSAVGRPRQRLLLSPYGLARRRHSRCLLGERQERRCMVASISPDHRRLASLSWCIVAAAAAVCALTASLVAAVFACLSLVRVTSCGALSRASRLTRRWRALPSLRIAAATSAALACVSRRSPLADAGWRSCHRPASVSSVCASTLRHTHAPASFLHNSFSFLANTLLSTITFIVTTGREPLHTARVTRRSDHYSLTTQPRAHPIASTLCTGFFGVERLSEPSLLSVTVRYARYTSIARLS
jgi:hypothetical protein